MSFIILSFVLTSLACWQVIAIQVHYIANDAPQPKVLQLTLNRNYNTSGIPSCNVTSFTNTQRHRLLSDASDVIVNTLKAEGRDDTVEFIKILGYHEDLVWVKANELCFSKLDVPSSQGALPYNYQSHFHITSLPLDIQPLIVSGPAENRVDFIFLSDGYLTTERDKFFADAKRLAEDMSQNQTFATVRPLINFWAAFFPSQESGIGVGGVPKNTSFGLYRDGTELRGVYTSKPDIARQACLVLGSKCDYPIILGNDPLYGGLGGEFVISTASEINGALVLRHELGHSVIEVGEEYDGGFAYFGVNAALNPEDPYNFPWAHWLSSPPLSDTMPRAECAIMPFQDYAWTMLNKSTPWSATFVSSGVYSRFLVRFSLSGLPKEEDLTVYLDGVDLRWKPRPNVGVDRWHYDIYRPEALSSGIHEIKFELGHSALEGTAQLCSVEIIEYGNKEEFNSTIGHYGMYPTFSLTNKTTYRPTNEQCLMRIVTSPNFCSVCKEGLWMSLLKRVSLLDGITVTVHDSPESVTLKLNTVPFDHTSHEKYVFRWWKDGHEMPEHANSSQITVHTDIFGTWSVSVQLYTPEIRRDPHNLLHAYGEIEFIKGRDTPRFKFV